MKEVIEKLNEGLKDPEYRQGWIANIAMAQLDNERWYMLVSTILAGGVMFCIGQMFGADGAIIAGILLLIAMASAVRYNV